MTDEELRQIFYTAADKVTQGAGQEVPDPIMAGIRAVEAAVRSDCMTLEEHASLCGELEALTEQLVAAQAVIAMALNAFDSFDPFDPYVTRDILAGATFDALAAREREVMAKALRDAAKSALNDWAEGLARRRLWHVWLAERAAALVSEPSTTEGDNR